MDLSIILLNYKSRGLLRQCLRGILRAPPHATYEIIVVDNASGDGTPAMVAREFPDVRCIASSVNTGFGPGNNIGIRASRGRYVLVMNPDVVVLGDALEELVSYMDLHPDIGICGPQLVNPDGSIQYSCYRFPTPMIPMYRRTPLGNFAFARRAVGDYLMRDWDHRDEREVDWLLGACIVLRRSMLDAIGLFDEQFFLYFEDTDLCRRAWEAGHRVVYNPSVHLVHYHKRESAGSFMQIFTNKVTRVHIASGIKYFQKYWGKPLPRVHGS
ncbi:glycosyltransferase family 2 protein [Candidatus Uhrbacteria bacterium]|nr:glycosyltransferase family 2 protein [Candidatus Uhrbacteria bacterium]